MKTTILFSLTLLFLSVTTVFSQTARIKGVVLDESFQPVENVSVSFEDKGATTDNSGFYSFVVPANKKITIVFSHITLKPVTLKVELKNNEDYEYNFVMKSNESQLGEVVVTAGNRKTVEGIITLEPAVIRKIPGANAGVENILKTLPGIVSNNDLSTQYGVRGGNYDENLVYVNEIEVYRPFLIRSGQQEGLSFTNTDMVQSVDFSAGGFQSKYGDRMSSVLDITYRIPRKFGAVMEASLLGGSLTVDAVSKNNKWTTITGVRYRDNSLFVNSQETETNFRPTFSDVQSYVTFTPNKRWQWSFLGNISQNKYNYQPLSRQTNFGTIDEPIALQVFYQGQEKDSYTTYFGALKSTFDVSDTFTLKFISSLYHTVEQEYFDIFAAYFLGEIDTNIGSETFGDVTFNRGIGTQLNHARNDLDALIFNAEVKGFHKFDEATLEWGTKFTREDIRDRLVEWEVIESLGYNINPENIIPVNDQPYNPYTGPLVPFQNIRATNFTTIDRLSGFVQWSKKSLWGSHEIWYNAGVRMHHWQISGQEIESNSGTVFSPRAQFAVKPNWDKDMVFRFATGLYHQPPFYRELRDFNGEVQSNVKAQQSFHFVVGNDYSFKMWDRPFKLISEAYYKDLTNVNTYTLDNVRIRYKATNDATAFAYGLDLRLNGEFVPGTESWFSFGYLRTEENQNNRGFIARPTDQRLKFGILFQDYVPNIPSLKLYLNLIYNTGLPGGAPSYADVYDYQQRLRNYARADVGFSYVLTENNHLRPEGHWLKKFQDVALGFEIFNLFNNQNAITNTWVRDVESKNQYGIPNYMTTRVFNIKLNARL
ncbi:TonB-dependent receptor [Flavobacterium orientale]|uniref:TonB-dependent receptor n=1 Tax=Flavobacterium orientale TaxID=1756020 RepID=A0A916Y3G3_9FLAO|nr:TonB-dependent receptor [Flavobacterium orientale]GGD29685.1 TonB-dependent receptor [Flavobacterium orientale]